MSKTVENFGFILGREEVYEASPRVWSFKHSTDIVEGVNLKLSNMVGCFPFVFGGVEWRDSERLYLCGEFSQGTEEHNRIQQALVGARSGYAAKRFVKRPNKKSVRADFTEFRLQWMLFVVWQKCKGNAEFRKLLLQIPSNVTLVENTTTDKGGTADIWGCRNKELVCRRNTLAAEITEANASMKKKDLERLISIRTNQLSDIGEWRGQNNMGKVLMICRQAVIDGVEPVIDYDLLRNAQIHILGQQLQFD